MWVVSDAGTGYSNEEMRFATRQQAQEWIDEREDELGTVYVVRYEP
jgi:hypothetical protein